MKSVYLIRDEISAECVLSVLYVEGEVFQVLERPWLNNERNKSCICVGSYLTKFISRSASGKYKNVFHVTDTPGRTGILIHSGNVVAHSKGCLLIGKRRGRLAGGRAILNSKTALLEFAELVGTQDFTLNIFGSQKC